MRKSKVIKVKSIMMKMGSLCGMLKVVMRKKIVQMIKVMSRLKRKKTQLKIYGVMTMRE